MAKGNVVADVRKLAQAALKSGHALHGAVITPAQWATEAGYPGSAASPLRRHMARQSSNGCGRNNRYGAQDARGMLLLLDLGDEFATADAAAKKERARRRTASQLAAHKAKKANKDKARTQARKAQRATKKATGTGIRPPEQPGTPQDPAEVMPAS